MPTVIDVRQQVKETISSSTETIRKLVVEELVKEELDRRKKAVLDVLVKIDAKDKELKQAQSQGVEMFNGAGEKVGEPQFTKDQIKKVKELSEELGRMHDAVDKAFAVGDFSKLLNLAK